MVARLVVIAASALLLAGGLLPAGASDPDEDDEGSAQRGSEILRQDDAPVAEDVEGKIDCFCVDDGDKDFASSVTEGDRKKPLGQRTTKRRQQLGR